ncbi:MAG: hypothetical protein HY791_33020 [Deltaproteobacteria bacterium]|nr:hypothetical protein [Deltaproteobacteria bacterium]
MFSASLWRVQLRALTPFLVLVLMFSSLDWFDELLNGYPDQVVSAGLFRVGGEGNLPIRFLMAFALGMGLLVRDIDERMMEFLDAIPVGRASLFAAKVLLAFAILMIMPISEALLGIVLGHFSRTSLSNETHFGIVSTQLGLFGLQVVDFLALALVLSFLRRHGWLVMGLLYWTYELWRRHDPRVEKYNFFRLSEAHFFGESVAVPWSTVACGLVWGAFGLSVSYLLYRAAGDRFFVLKSTPPGRWRQVGGGLGFVAIVILGGATMGDALKKEEPDSTLTLPTYPMGTARSSHYTLMFPAQLARRAEDLMAASESVYATLRTFFGTDLPSHVAVDGSGSRVATAGTAHGSSKVRLRLEDCASQTCGSILAHETAHMFANHLTKGRLSDHGSSTAFFNEGLATYVEIRLFPSSSAVEEDYDLAAGLLAHRNFKLEDIADADKLHKESDRDVVYPLGYQLVRTMLEAHGEDSAAKVLRALAREEVRNDLVGLTLWRDAFQAAGFDFEMTMAKTRSRLKRLARLHKQAISKIPRLVGVSSLGEELWTVEVMADVSPPFAVVCRVRATESTDEEEYLIATRTATKTFAVDAEALPSDVSISYQLGLRMPHGKFTVYERWVEVVLD